MLLLLAIGFVLFAEARKNYRKRGRQLVGPVVALAGSILLLWSTAIPFLTIFVAVALLMLLNAVGQFVMGRRLDRARAALPPAAAKPPRTVDPSAPPPPEFAARANVGPDAHTHAEADPFAFWAEQAGRLQWDTPWDTVFDDGEMPTARWFTGGRLNVAVNCVDRHVTAGRGGDVAGIPGHDVTRGAGANGRPADDEDIGEEQRLHRDADADAGPRGQPRRRDEPLDEAAHEQHGQCAGHEGHQGPERPSPSEATVTGGASAAGRACLLGHAELLVGVSSSTRRVGSTGGLLKCSGIT